MLKVKLHDSLYPCCSFSADSFNGNRRKRRGSSCALPDASIEAIELFQFLKDGTGRESHADRAALRAAPWLHATGGRLQKATGHYPAVFSQDFGFSEPGTWDGINYRQAIVDEAIRRHEERILSSISCGRCECARPKMSR